MHEQNSMTFYTNNTNKMALPCVLFSSSSENFSPREFVKYILKVPELPKPQVFSESIDSYEWSFETKYYNATIHLCTTESRTIGDKNFAESVQAFVHFFDPNVPSSFELTKAWLPYLSHIEPDILMLVCHTSKHTDAIERKVALEWCIQNGFELVELDPEQDDEDEEDDFPETTGLARIVQALHAHTWPNLDMKDSPTVQSPYLRQMMKEQHMLNKQQNQATENSTSSEHSTEACDQCGLSDTSKNSNSASSNPNIPSSEASSKDNSKATAESSSTDTKTSDKNVDKSSGDASCSLEDMLDLNSVDWVNLLAGAAKGNEDAPLSDGDMGVEEFEELFRKLKITKDKAETLPLEERRKYAEKITIAFWKAIGGDEDEIEGLDVDSD